MGQQEVGDAVKLRLESRHFMIAAACFGLLMVGGFIIVIRREQDVSTLSSAGSFLLMGLAFLNVLLMATLLFVLFRELVKGFLAWRRQREGARLRTRLLTAFLLLGLVPSLLLFISAIFLIESTVDRWFHSPVNSLTNASQSLVDEAVNMARDQSCRKANALAWQLREVPPKLRAGFLNHLYKGGDTDAFCLIDRSGGVLAKQPPSFPAPNSYKVGKTFGPLGLTGWLDLSPTPTVVSGSAIDETMGIIVGRYLPERLFKEARFISVQNKEYLQIKGRQKLLKISMISSFLALTLLVTFTTVWIGSHILGEISNPLQLLLEGTQEISRGNLSHQIEYSAKDEFGMLVGSFNEMTRELMANKSELERRNKELRSATEFSEQGRRYIETLVETLDIGVISISTDGRIHTLNSKARSIVGLQPDEPKRNILSRPEWAPIAAVLNALPNRPVFNRETTIAKKAGHVILSVTVSSLKEASGSLFGSLIILDDISDLSRAQRIAAWQEAARRMAHEIKNPLTPIRLSAQRIRKKARQGAEDLESAIMEGCTTIEREVQGILNMVNEFSRFARLPELLLKPVSLPDLIKGTTEPYRSVADLKLDFPVDFPLVRLDSEQIGRVIKNLVENGVQAMQEPGTIAIELSEKEGKAVIAIRDTGPGIPEEDKARLFTPYFSTKRKGTGLGLAIVSRILEEHGGSIHLDESYDKGAGFILTLPM